MSSHWDVEHVIRNLTQDEKINLLSGGNNWGTYAVERLNVPSITAYGPHGARGTSFFNGPRGALLPSATAMGATFDKELMRSVGGMLATESKEKGCQVLLGPTVCLQRSPLLGRGFEAFGEDRILSGLLASDYINGLQAGGVAACIKHYAVHDQSSMSLEDDVRASERTLRETHLLPFQLAVRHANPWLFMSSYHRINGVHTFEDPWLNTQLLRNEWGWEGMLMSDWGGTCSTSEALNAGMDLEMPGPTRWRGERLELALLCQKVKMETINERVRQVLNLVNKVRPALEDTSKHAKGQSGDTAEKRKICREVSRSSIVLLKNDASVLPLNPSAEQTYGLIGPAVSNPAASGGGSADLVPYYISKPLEAIQAVVGRDRVKTAIGCYSHLSTPLLTENVSVPGKAGASYELFWYGEDPTANPAPEPIHTTTTTEAQIYFADNVPAGVPGGYWLRVESTFTAPKTTTFQIGLSVTAKARLYIDGQEAIDLWTGHPEKTRPTSLFNQGSMEVTADLVAEEGVSYKLSVLFKNESIRPGYGAQAAGGVRFGCCEKVDPAEGLKEAVELAKAVDVPIVIAGLSSDYECEAMDRPDLELPAGINELIAKVLEANPRAVSPQIIVTQSGSPITLPWVDNAPTLLHAWFGGQETGNAIADVLFGHHDPTGRLSITFPRRIEDTPAFLSWGKGVRQMYYGEGVFIGYRYVEKLKNDPLFYFGHGLSYTKFEYSNLSVPESVSLGTHRDQLFEVSVEVANTGDRDGHEIVQLYVSDVDSKALRPLKELKGFTKVYLTKGEKKMVKISLDKYALSYWNEWEEKWHAEKGTFKMIISRGADPKEHVLEKDLELVDDLYWTGV
ncbi:glycoside hydrolase superfamily [Plectosphaerella plurivora]|uniref:beta-glucosidase n=1 Tax=Plectosphaerella plurivora TaxID=936078 RepID=A0A9P9A972_9PEZI|nr:glycoside hydrolase superfamily [Plectosphaerella plurivora]